MTARILLGALLGLICKFPCNILLSYLFKKRDKVFSETDRERAVVFAALAVGGAAICALVPLSAETLFLFLLMIIAEVVSVADIHERIIPNDMVLAIILLTLVFGVPGMLGAKGFPVFHPLRSFAGLAAGFVIFSLPSFFSGKVGAGDIKLAAAVGFCMGIWFSLISIILMGCFVLAYTLLQKSLPAASFIKSMIPMGPFISISAVLVLTLSHLPAMNAAASAFPF